MVLVQKWPFFQLFFLGNIGQENVFNHILERKSPFLTIKTRSLEVPKIEIFPKALVHGFFQNWPFLHILFLVQSRPGEFVSSVGEHISLGICVFYMRKRISQGIYVFPWWRNTYH